MSFFIVGAVFFVISLIFRRGIKNTIWLFLFGFLVILLLLNWVGMERTAEEMSTIFTSLKLGERVGVYEEARFLLRDYPVFGVGIGCFSDIFPMYRSGFGIAFYPHLHNEILQLLVEAGWAGFIIISLPFIVFLVRFFAACGKTRLIYKYYISMGILAAFLYLGLHTLISFGMRLNSISALFVILLSLAVLVMHLRPLPGKTSEIDMKIKKVLVIKNAKSRTASYILSSFIFVYLGFIISKPFIAHTLAENAITLSAFERAISLDPTNADLYYRYHKFILIQSDLGVLEEGVSCCKAKGALDKAIRLNPHKSAYPVAKGFLGLRQENYKEASSALREAAAMEPNNHRVRLIYAYALFQEGLNEKDEKKKDMLLKKGLIHYKTARFLCPYVNLYSTIDDKKSFQKLAQALRKEGIIVQ
ncbi:MAG: O-antigen ligase family protein [Candidatus Omnitrophota bacterium]